MVNEQAERCGWGAGGARGALRFEGLAERRIYVDGGRDLLDELLGIFAQDAPVQVDAIRRAIAAGAAADLMRDAHTLKVPLKVLGATAAAQLAQDLEARGRAGDLSDARELGASLEAEIGRILQSLPIAKRK